MGTASFRFGRRRAASVIILRQGDRERSLTLRPGLVLAALAVTITIAIAGLAAGGYVVFHDTIVAALLRHQAAIETSYEDRIAALRLQIDRLATRQVLEQDGVEAKVDALAKQNSALSDTGSRLADLVRKAQAAGLALDPAPKLSITAPVGPVTAPGTTLAAGRQAALDALFGGASRGRIAEAPVSARLTALERDADLVHRQQFAVARHLADGAANTVDLIEATMGRLGVADTSPHSSSPTTTAPRRPGTGANAKDGVGGPFVAVDSSPAAAIGRAETLLAKLDTLRRRLATLPLRRPLVGELTVTSPFGGRPDPFMGVLAMHTGIDFRADQGTPVLATAPGTIEATGRQGGYGLAVDIDHGSGIATRYGHLSRIAVVVGQHVTTGTTIGYAGSTGRSTGPHLHYETRVGGEVVDPTDWLTAGERLNAFLD